jgi:hypothetical protein
MIVAIANARACVNMNFAAVSAICSADAHKMQATAGKGNGTSNMLAKESVLEWTTLNKKERSNLPKNRR